MGLVENLVFIALVKEFCNLTQELTKIWLGWHPFLTHSIHCYSHIYNYCQNCRKRLTFIFKLQHTLLICWHAKALFLSVIQSHSVKSPLIASMLWRSSATADATCFETAASWCLASTDGFVAICQYSSCFCLTDLLLHSLLPTGPGLQNSTSTEPNALPVTESKHGKHVFFIHYQLRPFLAVIQTVDYKR